MTEAVLAPAEPEDIYSYSYSDVLMNTTIQISVLTKQQLDSVKSKEGAKSYDEVVQHLLAKHTIPMERMFGAFKGARRWNRELDRMKFHGE